MNTALIILASALAIAAFLGGCLGTCKTGKKEGICKYDNNNGNDQNC